MRWGGGGREEGLTEGRWGGGGREGRYGGGIGTCVVKQHVCQHTTSMQNQVDSARCGLCIWRILKLQKASSPEQADVVQAHCRSQLTAIKSG